MESTSGMVNLGKPYGLPAAMDAPQVTGDGEEVRMDFPTFYVHGVDLELPDGDFYFLAKGSKVGYNKAINGRSESCEIAIKSIKVKGPAEDYKMEEEKDAGERLLLAMLKLKGRK